MSEETRQKLATDTSVKREKRAKEENIGFSGGNTGSASNKRPRTRRSNKAKHESEVVKFMDIPNIGPVMARDFALLGLAKPSDLKGKDAFTLYQQICKQTGKRHDPCVLDTYMAAIEFMNGGPPRPWCSYTAQRKKAYPNV